MSASDIDAIRKREQFATRSPWTVGNREEVADKVDTYELTIHSPSADEEKPDVSDDLAVIRYYAGGFQFPHAEARSDAEFIAHARTDIPNLLAEVDRLRQALQDIARMVDQFDTPRDAGRVRAFIGDVGQIAGKGLAGERR